MRISEKQTDYLRAAKALSKVEEEVTPTKIALAMGFDVCARVTAEGQELEKLGLITRKRVRRGKMLVTITPAGLRQIADSSPYDLSINRGAQHHRYAREVTRYRGGGLDKDAAPLASFYRGPGQKLDSDQISALYAGQRYESIKEQFVQRVPMPRSYGRSLTGGMFDTL